MSDRHFFPSAPASSTAAETTPEDRLKKLSSLSANAQSRIASATARLDGDRCVVSLLDGQLAVQYAHIVPRSSPELVVNIPFFGFDKADIIS